MGLMSKIRSMRFRQGKSIVSPEFVTNFDKSLIRLEASMIYKTTNRVRVGDR